MIQQVDTSKKDTLKALILTVTAGQGHNLAANAIAEQLWLRDVSCEILDTLEYINPILSESVAKGYLMSTKYSPAVYGGAYRLAEKRRQMSGSNILSALIDGILAKKLINYIEAQRPDVIICTHVYSALLITHINKKANIPKTIGIITDFTVHPFWEDTLMNYYVTASEMLTNQCERKGILSNKVIPSGIPIHPKFANKTDMKVARRSISIPDKKTVLVMSGSMGYGKVTNIIKELDSSMLDFQIISVCGNNKRLKRNIDKLELRKTIYNYGFVNNVDVLMDASDCVITKPGGLTVSEALAKKVPIILINPIPGQEDRNVEFLLNHGAAMKISSTFTAEEAVYQLFKSRERRSSMIRCAEDLSKPDSAIALCEFLIRCTNTISKLK